MAKYSAIIKKLPEAFEKGVASGDLLFFPSTTVKHTENEVEVRYYMHLDTVRHITPSSSV